MNADVAFISSRSAQRGPRKDDITLEGVVTIVDGFPRAGVFSARPIGMGRDRSKWEIPG